MVTSLVTGGAGFIGSWLCEALLDKGQKIICVDNFITGNKENIQHLLKDKNFTLLEHDVIKPVNINEKIDFIWHLASPASPVDYQKLPIETMLVNSIGTLNMLRLAEKKKARFLFASTSEVYGDPKEHPQKESYWGNINPVGPRSCYDESKRFGEALTMSCGYHNTRIVRIFNTYGPRMRADDGRAVPNFIMQALEKKPLTIYGNGSQTRSFCYVDDMVKGIIAVMHSKICTPVNLGNPVEMTILECAKMIIKLTASSSEIIFSELPKDDPTRRLPDITVAKSLGWKPETGLEEGLKKTIAYAQSKQKSL